MDVQIEQVGGEVFAFVELSEQHGSAKLTYRLQHQGQVEYPAWTEEEKREGSRLISRWMPVPPTPAVKGLWFWEQVWDALNAAEAAGEVSYR